MYRGHTGRGKTIKVVKRKMETYIGIKGILVRGTCPGASHKKVTSWDIILKKEKDIYRIHAGRGSSKHAKAGQGVDFLGCGQVAVLGAVEGAAAGRYGGGAPAAARGCRGQGAGRFFFLDGLGRQRRRVRWCVPAKCHMR